MKFETIINKEIQLEKEYNEIETKLGIVYNKLNSFENVDMKSLSKPEQMDWMNLRDAKSRYETRKEEIENELTKIEKLRVKKLAE